MKRPLALVGTGGHGRIAADCVAPLRCGWIEFFDDKRAESGPWSVISAAQSLVIADANLVGVPARPMKRSGDA